MTAVGVPPPVRAPFDFPQDERTSYAASGQAQDERAAWLQAMWRLVCVGGVEGTTGLRAMTVVGARESRFRLGGRNDGFAVGLGSTGCPRMVGGGGV